MSKVSDLVKKRAAALDTLEAFADKPTLTVDEQKDYDAAIRAVDDLDAQIERARQIQARTADGAQPVGDQDGAPEVQVRELDPYTSTEDAKAMGLKTNKGLRAVACVKLFTAGGNNVESARSLAAQQYGERHPITRSFEPRRVAGSRALVTSVGASGGFIVPPDYVNEIIELLRPKAVVRASQPRTLAMPKGSLTLPGQNSAATASYGNEQKAVSSSQQTLKSITATFKKLLALVPVSNDMMRYADPAADAFVRDDLVKVMALREDLAFLLGDGTGDSPVGMLHFANRWVLANGGTGGNWLSTAASTMAVNGADPANSTGGNFITSNATPTLATVQAELGGAANRLDAANVDEDRRVWFMHPRSRNFLYDLTNSLGEYVFREELNEGKLRNYPIKTTTQIPTNIWDAAASNKDLSFVFLTEMDETMILDSMTLELMVSREGTYVDGGGNTVSALQSDQTVIRAITEHDFQMRHDQSTAIIQGVRWQGSQN